MPGFHKPFKLDVAANSGGLLVYVNGSLPARELPVYKLTFDIQTILFEINLRKEKWLLIGIYKLHLQNVQYFLNILADLLVFYSVQYDNKVVFGDFNLKPNNPILLDFLNEYNFTNLIKRTQLF